MNFINLFDFEIGVWSCQYSDANTWYDLVVLEVICSN